MTTEMAYIRGYKVRIHVEGGGDPLLLINGLTRPLEAWKHFTDEIPGRTIITFDAPGTGLSPTPLMPLSMTMLAGLAAGVLDAYGIEQADVLGFSHGGAVAQQMAISYPSRVRRLILAGTLCGLGAQPGNMAALNAMRTEDAPFLGTFWRLMAMATWSSVPFLSRIQQPTLVIAGYNDNIALPENSWYLASKIPNSYYTEINADHDLQAVGPAVRLAAEVDNFLIAESVEQRRKRRLAA